MSRLADRFVGGEWHFPLGIEETKPFVIEAARSVGAGPILLAQNVAEYVDQRGETELTDYPSLAPAWPSFWVEYPSTSGNQRRGVWVCDATDTDSPFCRGFGETLHAHSLISEEVDPGDVKWVVCFALFVEAAGGVWGPIGHIALSLDADGAPLGRTWTVAPLVDLAAVAREAIPELPEWDDDEPTWPTEEQVAGMTDDQFEGLKAKMDARLRVLKDRRSVIADKRDQLGRQIEAAETVVDLVDPEVIDSVIADETGRTVEWLDRALAPAYQSVAFLHCRNVEVEEHDPPPKVQAKRAKRGKRPLLRYHTLRLVVPRQQAEGDTGAETHRKALHIVAGHFAHYGACCSNHEPNGLLFGKYEGVYWHPSHVRGNADRGTVRTDFDLVVPS